MAENLWVAGAESAKPRPGDPQPSVAPPCFVHPGRGFADSAPATRKFSPTQKFSNSGNGSLELFNISSFFVSPLQSGRPIANVSVCQVFPIDRRSPGCQILGSGGAWVNWEALPRSLSSKPARSAESPLEAPEWSESFWEPGFVFCLAVLPPSCGSRGFRGSRGVPACSHRA